MIVERLPAENLDNSVDDLGNLVALDSPGGGEDERPVRSEEAIGADVAGLAEATDLEVTLR